MGIREGLNRNSKLTAAVVGGIILVVVIVFFRGGGGGSGTLDGGGRVYFSNDDGKTWFADSEKKIPPFMKDGKQAYRVYVYKCADEKPFVTYLERYTSEAKSQMESLLTDTAHARSPDAVQRIQMGIEVKAPGDTRWIRQLDPKARSVISPKCPGGGEPSPVVP